MMNIKKANPKYKKGLDEDSTAHYIEFGKYMINNRFLKNGELLTKYKKSYAPTVIKKTKISKLFESILVNIFDTEEINYELVQDLSDDEQELFKRLIIKSGVADKLDFDERKIYPSVKQLVEKFNVLKGEILAGNDNKLILQDMENVLNKLLEKEVIDSAKFDEIMALLK
jgi:hypothetical protein